MKAFMGYAVAAAIMLACIFAAYGISLAVFLIAPPNYPMPADLQPWDTMPPFNPARPGGEALPAHPPNMTAALGVFLALGLFSTAPGVALYTAGLGLFGWGALWFLRVDKLWHYALMGALLGRVGAYFNGPHDSVLAYGCTIGGVLGAMAFRKIYGPSFDEPEVQGPI